MSFEIERFIIISGLWPTIPHIDGSLFPKLAPKAIIYV